MIAIVNTGGANLNSVVNALDRLNVSSTITTDPDVITQADHVIFPGVGAAADSMARLRHHGLVECLSRLKQPTLGICLGMQLLFAHSEEGSADGLAVIPGTVKKFSADLNLSVPHMGWNTLVDADQTNPLLAGISFPAYFYFIHSYFAPAGEHVKAYCDYGEPFAAVVQKDNYFGVQFHPEKSANAGSRLLRNFLDL